MRVSLLDCAANQRRRRCDPDVLALVQRRVGGDQELRELKYPVRSGEIVGVGGPLADGRQACERPGAVGHVLDGAQRGGR